MIEGQNSILYVINKDGLKNVICVKSFDISIGADIIETTTIGNGDFKANKYDRFGWTCRLGTVAKMDGISYTGFSMTDAMLNREELELIVFMEAENKVKIFYGKCLVTVSDMVFTPIDLVQNELEFIGTGDFLFSYDSEISTTTLEAVGYTDLQALSSAYITEGAINQIKLLSKSIWDQGIQIKFKIPKTTFATAFEYDYLPIIESGVYITDMDVSISGNYYDVKLTYDFDTNFENKKIKFQKGCRVKVKDIFATKLSGNTYKFNVEYENGLDAVGSIVYINSAYESTLDNKKEFNWTFTTTGINDIRVLPLCYEGSFGGFKEITVNTTTCVDVGIIGSPTLPHAIAGVPYSHTKALTGSSPFTLVAMIKPSWMTISISGGNLIFSGIPTMMSSGVVDVAVGNCSSGVIAINQFIDVSNPIVSNEIENVGIESEIYLLCGSPANSVYVNNSTFALAIGVQVFYDSSMTIPIAGRYLVYYPTTSIFKTNNLGVIESYEGVC